MPAPGHIKRGGVEFLYGVQADFTMDGAPAGEEAVSPPLHPAACASQTSPIPGCLFPAEHL